MQAVDRVIKCGQYIHMLLALLRRNHESHSGSAGSAWLMCPTLIHLFTGVPQFLPHISSGSKTPQQYDSYSYSYPTYTCTGYLHVFVYDSANMHAVPVSLSRCDVGCIAGLRSGSTSLCHGSELSISAALDHLIWVFTSKLCLALANSNSSEVERSQTYIAYILRDCKKSNILCDFLSLRVFAFCFQFPRESHKSHDSFKTVFLAVRSHRFMTVWWFVVAMTIFISWSSDPGQVDKVPKILGMWALRGARWCKQANLRLQMIVANWHTRNIPQWYISFEWSTRFVWGLRKALILSKSGTQGLGSVSSYARNARK